MEVFVKAMDVSVSGKSRGKQYAFASLSIGAGNRAIQNQLYKPKALAYCLHKPCRTHVFNMDCISIH